MSSLAVRFRSLLPLLSLLTLALWPAAATANGGTMAVADRPVGPYLVAVMTSPSPLRTGVADVSVLVYLPGTQKVVENATVFVVASPSDQAGSPTRVPATHANATNKLYYAANLPLANAGTYHITVQVNGPQGGGNVSFDAQVAPGVFGLSPFEAIATAIPILGFAAWYLLSARYAKKNAASDPPASP
jgi:hypothetical protein